MTWFKKLIDVTASESPKSLVFLVLTLVHIVALFLIMYIPVEIANKALLADILDWNSWLIIATGGLVGLEPVLSKWRPGGPKNIVNQDVEKQTVVTEKEEGK